MTDQTTVNGKIDKQALLAKYRAERDKRLRPDGNAQYLRLEGAVLATTSTTPTRRSSRARRRPITSPSPSSAAALPALSPARGWSRPGVNDVRIVEKGGDFGGTWYWNRYPGAQCDTASMVYMPLLEETGHMPSEKYAHAPEILEQCQRIGKQYGLYDNALFHTEVTDIALGRRRASSGWSRPTAATTSPPASSASAPDRCTSPSCPASPASRRSRATRSTPAAGTTTTPAAIAERRAARQAGRQARRHHRHRRDGGAGRAAPRPRLQAALRLPAHAVVGRRARQRADRSRVVRRHRDAGLAAALAGEFHRQPGGRPAPRKTWCRTAGPICRAASARKVSAAAREADAGRDAGGVRGLRLREDGGDPRPRRRDRRTTARPPRS